MCRAWTHLSSPFLFRGFGTNKVVLGMAGQNDFSQSHISVIKTTNQVYITSWLCIVCHQEAADVLVSLPLHTNSLYSVVCSLVLPSGRLYCSLRSRAARFCTRVFPTAIKLLNSTMLLMSHSAVSFFKGIQCVTLLLWIFYVPISSYCSLKSFVLFYCPSKCCTSFWLLSEFLLLYS